MQAFRFRYVKVGLKRFKRPIFGTFRLDWNKVCVANVLRTVSPYAILFKVCVSFVFPLC